MSTSDNDYVEGRLDLTKYLIRHHVATFYVRVSGNSMVNAGIHPGSILVVDRAVEAKNGDIVIARLNNELIVKRLRVSGGEVWLLTENPAYNPIKVTKDSDFEVWGRVMHIINT